MSSQVEEMHKARYGSKVLSFQALFGYHSISEPPHVQLPESSQNPMRLHLQGSFIR